MYALNWIVCLYPLYFMQNYASRCHVLRLSVLNKETTYLLLTPAVFKILGQRGHGIDLSGHVTPSVM